MTLNSIVSSDQVTALKNGLDAILAPIKQALQDKVYVENLPIVGSLLGSVANQGQAALAQFAALETEIYNGLNSLGNVANLSADAVKNAIKTALTSAGFAADGVVVSLDPNSGQLSVSLNDSATDHFATGLGSDFGLPGLDFQTAGTADTTLTYDLNVAATVDASGNFSVTSPSPTALTVNLDVAAPQFSATGTLGSANDTLLGALRFGAVDQGSSLDGTFSLDTSGNATFSGNSTLDVQLTSDMGTAALPSISADLVGAWSFENSTVDPTDPAAFGDAPSIALDNVTYKLGTFVDNFIDPVINDINAILQSAPIKDALALFNTSMDFLGGGAKGDNGLLGTFWHKLDVGGAIDPTTGLDTGDGKITLVDFLQLAQDAGAPIDVTPLVQFLNAVTDVQNWVAALAASGTSFGDTSYSLGSFSIPDDIRTATQLISQVVPVQDPSAPPQDLNALLSNLVTTGGTPTGTTQTPAQALQALLTSPTFSFPIITNPTQAIQFLLGGTVDLFDANLPPASLDIGTISSTGAPINPVTLISVPIPTPLTPFGINLDLSLAAAFAGSVGLDFGYDTSGITAYANSGFTAPGDILDGFFVEAPTVNGTVEPVVQLAGDVQLGATLALGALASVSASGDVGGTLDLSFRQAGKNYVSALASELQTDPYDIFTASGRVTAGFEAVAKAIFLSPWTYFSPRVTLAQLTPSGAATGTAIGPTIPNNTTWVAGATGDFETAANWSPSFAAIGGTDYYGDATIGAGDTVTFAGSAPADLTSLTLGGKSLLPGQISVLALTAGQMTIEDSTGDSANYGSIRVSGTANLIVAAGFDNEELISLTGGGTLVASGLLDLHGGGAVELPDAVGSVIQSTDPNSLLWNEDNSIFGGGTIGAALLNAGLVEANKSHPLLLAAADFNQGVLQAVGNYAGIGSPQVGGLDIGGPLDNSGGTIEAYGNGVVLLEDGVTLTGGTLVTSAVPDGSVITSTGSVILNGGTDGLDIAGLVVAGAGSTLTVEGLVTGPMYSASLGQSALTSGNGIVLLNGATIQAGELDARAPATGTAGSIGVAGTATLDGSAGDGAIGLDGLLQVSAGNTLTLDGWVDPGLDGGGIELAGGTLMIGDAIADFATLGSGGTLLLHKGSDNVVTGADALATLTNSWTILGSGQLGAGQLRIVNAAGGTIFATGTNALVLDAGAPVQNLGLLEAVDGILDLKSDVDNAGGSISAVFGQTWLDGDVVRGGTLGVGLAGSVHVAGHALLDGTVSPIFLAADFVAGGVPVAVDAGDTLALTGSIVNAGGITVIGDTNLGSVAVLQTVGLVTLTGGGTVSLADRSASGGSATQVVTGVTGSVLDNIDNILTGYGSLGIGDASLTLINEAAGTVDATADAPLVVNTGTQIVFNLGLLEATDGGTLDLNGSIANAGAIVRGDAGTVVLANASLAGGSIATTGTGAIRVIGNSMLDGLLNAVTVSAGADVGVDAGNVLTVIGTLLNYGDIHAAGALGVATGSVPVTNRGRLAADGGTVEFQSDIDNAGGTVAVTAGVAVLEDGMTLTNGLIAGQPPGSGYVAIANTATLVGTGAVAATVTSAPTTGLLNTADIRIGDASTLTVRGTLTNRNALEIIGGATGATLDIGGAVVFTGGGRVMLKNADGVTDNAVIAGSGTLDNIDNIVSGYGQVGTGNAALTLINQAAGTVDATNSSLVIDTGANAIDNRGLLTASTGELILHGLVDNTGTVAADGGTTELDGATIAGGVLATSAGGVIRALGNATLDGTTPAITVAANAQVIVGGASTLTLAGTIDNQGDIALAGDSYDNLVANLDIAGPVTLTGGGTVSLYSFSGAPAFADQVITGADPAASLDNIDNTIAGYGMIDAGQFVLTNETAGTIEAIGGTLVISSGTQVVANAGLLQAVDGTLVIEGVVDGKPGGVVATRDQGGSGIVQLDAGTLRGGTLRTDPADPASQVQVAGGGGTLDGTQSPLTLAPGTNVVILPGSALTATGSIVNNGTLQIDGDGYYANAGTLLVAGTLALTGTGDVGLADTSGYLVPSDQIITGATLDNISNTISGYGELGAGQLTLINETAGTIAATAGTLVINTGSAPVTNHGLLEALGGTLLIQSDVNATAGATLAAFAGGAAVLDGITIAGGTIATDGTSSLSLTAQGGTLDGSTVVLTLAAGSHAIVAGGQTLTMLGAITEAGTLSVLGNGGYNEVAELGIAGTVFLTGGGDVVLADGSNYYNVTTTQVITGTTPGNRLDNVDDLISGYGRLGAGQLTLINEAKGTIAATTATLVLNTGAVATVNRGLLEANAAPLVVQTVIDNTAGGVIAAIGTGDVQLDGGSVLGGTITTDASSTLSLTAAGGTLDGSAGVLTLAAGSNAIVAGGQTLTLRGAISEAGTLSVLGNGGYNEVAELAIAGTVALTGGGRIVLADGSNYYDVTNTQVITGSAAGAELDNAAQISGYGQLGDAGLAIINEAAGTITATGGLLVIDAGADTAANLGQVLARAGTAQLEHTLSNAGTMTAGTAGGIIIDGLVRNSGTIVAAAGGTVTVHGTIATGIEQVAGGGSLVLDGGFLLGGSLDGATGSAIELTTGTATLSAVAFRNAGTTSIAGNGGYNQIAELALQGTTTLSGGGSVVLTDASNYYNNTNTQVITGVAPGDGLDNIDNTISGYGQLGDGQLTLINEAKGTIVATTAALVVNTGAVALVNHGVLLAKAAPLVVQTVIDDTAVGVIEAAGGGDVQLDGGTVRGGTISTDGASMLSLTTAGGTLDGSAGALTLAAGSNVIVAAGQTLTLRGAISETGTLSVLGNGGYNEVAELAIAGTVALTGGGRIVLADGSNYYDVTNTQVITGSAAGAELDNAAQISGYGQLGDAGLAIINETPGTITATGGVLIIDAGANTAANLGQVFAHAGSVQIEDALSNAGTMTAGASGGIIIDGRVRNTGTIAAAAGGTVTVAGTLAGGTDHLASGGSLVLDGGFLLGGSLDAAAGSAIALTIGTATMSAVAFSNAGTTGLTGNGGYNAVAQLSLEGVTTLSGGGAVMLADGSDYYNATATQVITGVAPGDGLDNIDNTISGYGELGAGQLTLINEAKGTIVATTSALVVNTGDVALVNHGLLQANAGNLVVQTVIDDTAGGVIATVKGGDVQLDGGTILGGTITTDASSSLSLTANGGTLDGSTQTLTLAAGSNASIAAGQTLSLRGAIVEAGTLSLLGNGGYGVVAELDIAGTVALTGSGIVVLADTSNYYNATTTQVVTGTAAGAELDNSGTITGYGSLGAGQLLIVNEATGTITEAGGVLIIDPAGGTLGNAGLMQALAGSLGVAGDLHDSGELRATGGASLSAASLSVGGVGARVDIDGVGSNLTLTGNLDVGLVGPGVFSFGPDTDVSIAGSIHIGASGTFDALGTLDPSTLINDGMATLGGFERIDGAIDNSGWFTISSDQVTIDAANITFDPGASGGATGTWAIGGGGTLVLNVATVDASQTISFSGPDAVLVIGQAPDIDANGTVTGTVAPDAANVLLDHHFQAVLESFAPGDEIRFAGLQVGSTTLEDGTITFWSGAAGTGTIEGSLNFVTPTGAPDAVGAAAAQLDQSQVACFTAGTLIETITGLRPVEQLRAGDQVVTYAGAALPIRWIGSRCYDARFAARNPAVWPVRIRAGALADGVPARDLLVSPQHAMYLDGCLVPAHLLINDTSIVQSQPMDEVAYFHVELETHAVIFAEGAATESYIDCDNRNMFQNAAEYARIDPPADRGPARDCAPRIDGGAAADALCERLAARADAHWHNPSRAQSIILTGRGCVRAAILPGMTELHLVSSNVCPSGDRRRLGALITGLRLDGMPIDLAGACCRRGFHQPEQHGGQSVRWTNGAGVVIVSSSAAERLVEIDVYAVMDESWRAAG